METVTERIERLISAAATLSRALELLATAQLMGEMRGDVRLGVDFYQEVTQFEIALINEALLHAEGSQVKAAELLRLNPSTLNVLVKRYKIDPKVAAARRSNRFATDSMDSQP